MGTFFKVVKTMPELTEYVQLNYIKKIGTCHIRILEGVDTYLQLSVLVAQLCLIADGKNLKLKNSILFNLNKFLS